MAISSFQMKTVHAVTDFYGMTADEDMIASGVSYTSVWTATDADYIGYDSDEDIVVGQLYIAGEYGIFRLALVFNTTTIVEGTQIGAASLFLGGHTDLSEDDFNIVVQSGMPTYPHVPVVVGDYNKAHYDGNGGYIHTSDFEEAAYNEIELNAVARGWINEDGLTKFVLRNDFEIEGAAPTLNRRQQIVIYSGDSDVFKPKLRIETGYVAPIIDPLITTIISIIGSFMFGAIGFGMSKGKDATPALFLLIMGFAFFYLIGWLPIWIFIFSIVVLAIMLAFKISGSFRGGGNQ